jgi:hypothetical protein
MKDQTDVCITRRTARQVSLRLDGIAVRWPIRHFAFVLEHDAGHELVILQILANAGKALNHIISKAAKRFYFADAREHQKLGAIDGSGGKDHFFVGSDILYLAVCHYFDAYATSTFKI